MFFTGAAVPAPLTGVAVSAVFDCAVLTPAMDASASRTTQSLFPMATSASFFAVRRCKANRFSSLLPWALREEIRPRRDANIGGMGMHHHLEKRAGYELRFAPRASTRSFVADEMKAGRGYSWTICATLSEPTSRAGYPGSLR